MEKVVNMICKDAKERSDASKVYLNDIDPDTGEVINLTRQEFKDDCDLNKIILRYSPEQLVESYNAFKGHYGDFSEIPDYQGMHDQVLATNQWFDSLPADIRRRFNHSVSEVVDFVENPANFDEAVKIGLLSRGLELEGKESPTSSSLDVTGGTDTASVS